VEKLPHSCDTTTTESSPPQRAALVPPQPAPAEAVGLFHSTPARLSKKWLVKSERRCLVLFRTDRRVGARLANNVGNGGTSAAASYRLTWAIPDRLLGNNNNE